MASTLTKAYVQYSKKLTTWLSILWCIIRLFSVIAVFVNPSCAIGMEAIIRGIDDVEMVCVCSYCVNSVGEKGITGYFNARAKQKDDYEEDEDSNG